MSRRTKSNQAIAGRLLAEVFNGASSPAIDELFETNCLFHDNNETARGTKAFKDGLLAFHNGFPDVRYAFDDVAVTDDHITVRWHADGTHNGVFAAIAPSGAPVSFWGISLFQLREGHIHTAWIASTLPEALAALRNP